MVVGRKSIVALVAMKISKKCFSQLLRFGEITSAIICGCLPATPRAIAQFKSKILEIASSCFHLRTTKLANSHPSRLRELGLKKSQALGSEQDGYIKLNDNSDRLKDQTISKPSDAACHIKIGSVSPPFDV